MEQIELLKTGRTIPFSTGPECIHSLFHLDTPFEEASITTCLARAFKGKKIATTTDWPHFLAREWPKHRPTVAEKFPGHVWR